MRLAQRAANLPARSPLLRADTCDACSPLRAVLCSPLPALATARMRHDHFGAASLPRLLLCGLSSRAGRRGADPAPAPAPPQARNRSAHGEHRRTQRRSCKPHGPTHAQKPRARSRRRAATPPHRRRPAPANRRSRPGRYQQRLRHRAAAAALRRAALGRGEPARRPGHALSDRVGLQAARPAGGDPARVRGLAAGAGPGRDQGLGASGDADGRRSFIVTGADATLRREPQDNGAAGGRAEARRDRATSGPARPVAPGARCRPATTAAISSAASSGAHCRARWSQLTLTCQSGGRYRRAAWKRMYPAPTTIWAASRNSCASRSTRAARADRLRQGGRCAAPDPRHEARDDGGRTAPRHRGDPRSGIPSPDLLPALDPLDHRQPAAQGRHHRGRTARRTGGA